MRSSTEAVTVGGACLDVSEKPSAFLKKIPFATLAGAICFLIGSSLFWPLRTKFDNGITEDSRNPSAYVGELHLVMVWLIFIYFFMIFVEVSTVLMAFASTGPTRGVYFATRRAQIAGRISCAVLIALHCLLLLGLHSVALSASHMWREMLVMEERAQKQNECLLYGRRFGDDWREEFVCDEAKMNALRDEMKAFIGSSSGMLCAMFILAFGVIVNMVCLAVNCARIKNQGQVTEWDVCENGKPRNEDVKKDLDSVEVA